MANSENAQLPFKNFTLKSRTMYFSYTYMRNHQTFKIAVQGQPCYLRTNSAVSDLACTAMTCFTNTDIRQWAFFRIYCQLDSCFHGQVSFPRGEGGESLESILVF